MNLFFVFEGEKTEPIVYRAWLKHLIPELSEITNIENVTNQNYYWISGKGIPQCYDALIDAIKIVNENDAFNYLVLVIDAERLTVEERKEDIRNYLLENNAPELKSCHLEIIVQNVCIETWFLGNKKVFPNDIDSEIFKQYVKHYNVREDDPELMPNLKDAGFDITAQFHESYLRELFKEKFKPPQQIRYSKRRPSEVTEKYYLEALQQRIRDAPAHLSSFQYFLDFCAQIRQKLLK